MVVPRVVMTVIMSMVMRVPVAMRLGGFIGSALGLEGAHHISGMPPETAHHFHEHVVGLDPDGFFADLGGRVPVADMPGDARIRRSAWRR